jgi:CRP-like cAMP-binding protein
MVTLRQFQAGEIILHEHDEGETAFIIERGKVEVTKELDGQTIPLASLGPGEVFGEMSMIDERPRSATVTAVEETVARELSRDEFSQSLQHDPRIVFNILRTIFEHLREANTTILHLQMYGSRPSQVADERKPLGPANTTTVVLMEGLTSKAACALPANPFRITKFPFRIGKQCDDPLTHNDLMIPDDEPPLVISRHHVTFLKAGGRIGVVDRGSRYGALLDGRQLGGVNGDPQPVYLSGSEGILVLGNVHSQFKYKVVLKTEE